jgi:hypothetical protein
MCCVNWGSSSFRYFVNISSNDTWSWCLYAQLYYLLVPVVHFSTLESSSGFRFLQSPPPVWVILLVKKVCTFLWIMIRHIAFSARSPLLLIRLSPLHLIMSQDRCMDHKTRLHQLIAPTMHATVRSGSGTSQGPGTTRNYQLDKR